MSDYTEAMKEALARQYNGSYDERLARATERQKEIARQNQGRKSMNGLGRATMEVDSKVYQEWVKKEGKEIWKDPKFRKYISEKNPELKVKSEGTGKIQVGYGS
jgi:hypothetical protein